MPTDDAYRGEERRVRNEWQAAAETVLADFRARLVALETQVVEVVERQEHVEVILDNPTEPEKGLVAIVRKIGHDLAGNTQVTGNVSRKVNELQVSQERTNEGIQSLLDAMATLGALNQIARFLGRSVIFLGKRVAPIAVAGAAAWGAIKLWWPKL